MRQRADGMDQHDNGSSSGSGGGALSGSSKLREANAEKLRTLLNRASTRAAATKRRNPALSGDYLDFENAEFGGRWINMAWAALVGLALFLFYVLWFTDWVR